MAVKQQKSDKLLAVIDSSVPGHRSKTTAGVKVRGRGFGRPTKSSKPKQVATQDMLTDVTKCQSVVMLKNLAKLLVDRIEAACAARNASLAIPPAGHSQVSNPKRNLNTAPPARSLHGPNPGRDADLGVRNEYGSQLGFDECAVSTEKAQSYSPHTKQPSGKPIDGAAHHRSRRKSRPRTQPNPKENLNSAPPSRLRLGTTNSGGITSQEVIRFCQSRAYGSNLDDGFCQSIRETNSSVQSDGNLNHSNRSIWEKSGSCRPSPHPSSNEASCQFIQESNRSVQSDGTLSHSSNILGASESCTPNSRPSSQPNPSGAYEGAEHMRTVTSLSSRMLTLKKVNVGLENCEIKPPKKEVHPKTRSPGLRSLVVPQGKGSQPPPPPPPTAQQPADTKLVLSSSKPMPKRGEAAKGKEERVKTSDPKELHGPIWADVMQSVFNEVFGDQGTESSRAGNKKHRGHPLSGSPRSSEEWIIQTQSIQYSYSTKEGARRGVQIPPKADRLLPTAPSTSREPPDSTEHSTRSKEEPSCRRPPVILPTLAQYHMDKIERYKKCVAEKQLRDSYRLQQECCRPSTAPDPYNVLNVYTERCAAQQKCHRPPVQKASERVPSNMDEMARPCGMPFGLRGATNLPHEQSKSELKAQNPDAKDRTTSGNELLQGPRDDLLAHPATANCAEAVSKKTRFRDYWPILDRQIEGFIQAHILQCCILFKNIPPIFPTLEYQEEIQRLYSGHPLSTP